jgi:hypothetical protein
MTTTIFGIERQHEYEGSNGSWYEWYIEEDEGFFTTREAASARLETLKARERAERHRAWERSTYNGWKRRVEENDRIVAQNEVLVAAGLPAIGLRFVGEEPTFAPRASNYQIIEVDLHS